MTESEVLEMFAMLLFAEDFLDWFNDETNENIKEVINLSTPEHYHLIHEMIKVA